MEQIEGEGKLGETVDEPVKNAQGCLRGSRRHGGADAVETPEEQPAGKKHQGGHDACVHQVFEKWEGGIVAVTAQQHACDQKSAGEQRGGYDPLLITGAYFKVVKLL